jgi:Ca2+-binding RTX toxin-like protein
VLLPLPAGSSPGPLDWSPDGSKIAFAYRFPGHTDLDIAVVAADGRGPITQLTTSPIDDHDPSWSPTGDRIAFDRGPQSGSITDGDLYVMNADGSGQTQVYDGEQNHFARSGTDWSPDGTTVLFSIEVSGTSQLFTIPAAGGTPKPLPVDGYQNDIASWGALASYDLTVVATGGGSGSVESSPAGISCTSCTATFADPTAVTLTPHPGAVSTFAGWADDCSGSGACVVPMTGDHTITARFDSTSTGGSGGGGAATPPVPAPTRPITPAPTSTPAPAPTASSTPARKQLGVTRKGTARADALSGTTRNDVLIGLAGNDRLNGGAGKDLLEGGAGNDRLTGGPGTDTMLGGPGNDATYAHDGTKDTVNCGAGRDIVFADRTDTVAPNCEAVHRS